jgi:peptide/nickel transport system substrate-binding protein
MKIPKQYVNLKPFVLFFIAAALLVPSTTQAQQPDLHTLVIGQSVDVETLDPSDVRSVPTGNVISHLFATLSDVSDKGEFVPYLAKSYKLSDDGTAITYTLNDGLTCQDGEALTAEDVVYSLDRAVKPENNLVGNSSLLNSIGYASATADDKLTVTVKFKAYNPTAVGTMAGVYIHCKDSYEKMSLKDAATKAIGSGPYRVVEWKRDN